MKKYGFYRESHDKGKSNDDTPRKIEAQSPSKNSFIKTKLIEPKTVISNSFIPVNILI